METASRPIPTGPPPAALIPLPRSHQRRQGVLHRQPPAAVSRDTGHQHLLQLRRSQLQFPADAGEPAFRQPSAVRRQLDLVEDHELHTRTRGLPTTCNTPKSASDRPQVVNVNYSYQIPDGSRIWKNRFTKLVLDGWHFNGITKLMSGTPLTVTCTASGAPIGYWTGTPIGAAPAFRSAARWPTPNPFLPAGSALPATAPKGLLLPAERRQLQPPRRRRLWASATLRRPCSWARDSRTSTSRMLKDIRLGKESNRMLEFRAEAYNVFNHFNPGNPNTSLTLNYPNGANTNANFGTITTARRRRVTWPWL